MNFGSSSAKFYGAIGISGLRFNDAKVERRLVRQRINFQRAGGNAHALVG